MLKKTVMPATLVALAAATLLLVGCSGKKTIVSVNGDNVKTSEFRTRLESIPVKSALGTNIPAGRYVIQQIVIEKLMAQLAEKEGVAPTKEQIDDKISQYQKATKMKLDSKRREELKRQIAVEQAKINLITKGVKITDEQVKQAYDEAMKLKPNPLERPEQVFISAIMTKTKDTIYKAYDLLNNKTDFGAVAMQLSDDPNTKQTGGKVNWVARKTQGVPDNICEKAFSLTVGKYSEPFKIMDEGQETWLILRADRRRPAKISKFDEVKDSMKEQMAMQQGMQKTDLAEKYAKFLKNAKIEVTVERYKDVPTEMKKSAKEALKLQAEELTKAAAEKQNSGN
ncbi:MAG: hypothetical protein A2Z18_10435 [Armatimonadetes bacterium RBG_16_58_9]|nr:MAG: hypothetical protein A2Z18_10435 [Armatimonadetes bacterium RBG_16_58_9]